MLSKMAIVREMPAKALIYAVLWAELCYVCSSGKYKCPVHVRLEKYIDLAA